MIHQRASASAGGGGGTIAGSSTGSINSGPKLVAVLEERLKAYHQAEAAAKQAGDAAKCRRVQRGVQVITMF